MFAGFVRPSRGYLLDDEGDSMKNRRCLGAFEAAYEVISRECGSGTVKSIPISEEHSIILMVPNPDPDPGPELSREQRIKAIMESDWGRHTAEGMCSKLFGVEKGTKEFEECVERVGRKIAIGMIE